MGNNVGYGQRVLSGYGYGFQWRNHGTILDATMEFYVKYYFRIHMVKSKVGH